MQYHATHGRLSQPHWLVIGINHSYAGFFAYLTFVLNQLRFAEKAGLEPVVYFGPLSGDGPNAFHDPAHGPNMWDYYFEPVGELTSEQLMSRIADPRDPATMEHVTVLDPQFLWYLHAYDPEGIYTYPYGFHRFLPASRLDAWYAGQRAAARRLMRRHIRVKQHVLAKVDHFWTEKLADRPVIGLHMRGSDKGAADVSPQLSRIVEPEEYFPHVDAFLGRHPDARVFLATEQRQFVDRVRQRFGEALVTRDVIRTDSFGRGSNVFTTPRGKAYETGEEVLIDCLLLSRCDKLIRCTSAVGEFAIYFSDGIEDVDLNRLEAPGPAGAGASAVEAFFGKGRLVEGATLINCDDRPDRLAAATGQLARFGLDRHTTRLSGSRHRNPMYGCSLSHLEVVRRAAAAGMQSVLILEDDIVFADDFERTAPAVLAELSRRDWGIFQFGMMMDCSALQIVSPHLFRFWRGHAAHAMLLHARTFDFLLRHYVCEPDRGNWNLPIHVPFDEYVGNFLSHLFPAYGSRKLLITQGAGRSDTWQRDVDYQPWIERSYQATA